MNIALLALIGGLIVGYLVLRGLRAMADGLDEKDRLEDENARLKSELENLKERKD